MRLSVLDQSPVVEGGTPSDALRSSVWLAKELDDLGITRYWVSEHHELSSYAGSAPEVLAATLLASTRNLRIGTGGVLLPRADATKVSETFRVLSGLFPGRVDLGIGRAQGPVEPFRDQVIRIRRELGIPEGADTEPAPVLMPVGVTPPEVWLLGLGTTASAVAAELGTAFCFGHFLNPTGGVEILESYRRQVSPFGDRRTALGVYVIAADTGARATDLARAYFLWRGGRDLDPIPSVASARRHRWTGAELAEVHSRSASLIAGPIERVHSELVTLAAAHEVDELVVSTLVHDPADRLRSYQLLAQAFDLRPATVRIAA